MYKDEQVLALQKFEDLATALGSQNKACLQVGISAAIISQLKKGAYPGDSDRQLEKLVSYFRVKDTAALLPSFDPIRSYVPTSISSDIYKVIENCQLQGGLAIACGDAGIGKTKAAKHFMNEHPNDAIYISLNPCLKTIKSLLKILCSKLNVNERTIDEMWLGICQKLRDGMVIIIDEAQHLPVKTIEALRAFSDYFSERGMTLGIAFVGNRETVDYFGGKQKAEFAQIVNRTKARRVLGTNQTKREDITLLFPGIIEDIAIDLLLNIARSSQAIRGAVNLYNNALDNDNTSYEGLIAMAKHMDMMLI